MPTILYSSPLCADHDTGHNHPERPGRLRAIFKALDTEEFAELIRREAPEVPEEALLRVHPKAYVDGIMAMLPVKGYVNLDPDTVLSPGSGKAALRAAGAVVAAVDDVAKGDCRNAFCAVRPPGHHAEKDHAMGFCLFNNIGIGALHAREAHGYRRIAVVDFDVHHGNGTQQLFEGLDDVLYISTHQAEAFPGSGREEDNTDKIINVLLEAGDGPPQFREAVKARVLPPLRDFKPDFIFISAGFDGHVLDSLAQLRLTEPDYSWITHQIVKIAEECCEGRVVSSLEGGYDLLALGSSVASHIHALMTHDPV